MSGRHHGRQAEAQFGGVIRILLLYAAGQQRVLGDGSRRYQDVWQGHGGRKCYAGWGLSGWDEEVEAVQS